jgi:hypothetical protein
MKNILPHLVAVSILILTYSINGQVFKTDKIKYNNQDIRQLAEEYLGNPNYWEAILSASDIKSLSELKEGDILIIPTQLVQNTEGKTEQTLNTIRLASENGAQVFTPELINNSKVKLEKSKEYRQSNNWQLANQEISEALSLARQSLEQSQLLRKQSADATISFKKGEVQNRTPKERRWSEAPLFSKLYEEDRARTLNDSYAEITFIDLSRVRLNENSQALIQRSRLDLLKNATDTKVKLIKGDAFAFLQKSPKKKFDIDIPGLDTRIKSKSFWVEKEETATKFANYEGEIELNAKGKTVVVKENQGSVIPAGGAPSDPKDLLPSPILMRPDNDSQFYSGDIDFNWEEVNEASKYWFEIARDQNFKKLVYANKSLRNTSTSIKSLSPGVYYWHVASIDEFGFPGKFSSNNFIHVIKDENSPYLKVTSPAEQTLLNISSILVAGETEKDCELEINGVKVNTDENGRFSKLIQLTEGYNKVVISAKDEAGNVSKYFSDVICETSPDVELNITNQNFNSQTNTFITNDKILSIRGFTRPLSSVKATVGSELSEYRAYSDTSGMFQYFVTIDSSYVGIKQNIVTASGFERSDEYSIILDTTPPIINLASPVPKQTNDKFLIIKGSTNESAVLEMNGKSHDTKIETTIELNEGQNSININATDKAGNISQINYKVLLDSRPPELIANSVKPVKDKKTFYLVTVSAKDESGLKQAIKIEVIDGNEVLNRVLKLDENSKVYQGTISAKQNLYIKSIVLEDYLGNSKKYFIH